MKTRYLIISLVLAIALMGVTQPAYAEQDTGRLVITKLFRGVTNLCTGWMEIPKQITFTYQEAGPGSGFTWGFMKGIGYAIVRTASGAYEIVSFPFPAPEGYGPIMQPEYVLSDLPTDPQPR